MKESLTSGLTTKARITIDAGRTIDFMGDAARIYATPELVRDIEMTCRDLVLQHADEGEDSVGTRVEVEHMAATPLGAWVELTATITAVNGRALTFEITGRDPLEQICRGQHSRFVVDVTKTAERLKTKADKLEGL